MSGETNKNPGAQKKKRVRKNELPFKVLVKYVERPKYQGKIREAPVGYNVS